MLKVRLREGLTCPKHPRFDPAIGGPGAVRGGCDCCHQLCMIQGQADKLAMLVRGFTGKRTARAAQAARAD